MCADHDARCGGGADYGLGIQHLLPILISFILAPCLQGALRFAGAGLYARGYVQLGLIIVGSGLGSCCKKPTMSEDTPCMGWHGGMTMLSTGVFALVEGAIINTVVAGPTAVAVAAAAVYLAWVKYKIWWGFWWVGKM